MKNGRLNFYFFGDLDKYDDYNPAYVLSKEYVPEILYLVASNEPFSVSKNEIASHLNIEDRLLSDIMNSLHFIHAIEVKTNTYKINFPVFLEEDISKMERHLNNIGELIGNSIMTLKETLFKKVSHLRCSKHFCTERILYHIICDKIFDGTALEYFAHKRILSTSKVQPGNMDYIIVSYEDSEKVEKYSKDLLCSSNNYKGQAYVFNSFGDSNGTRKDMFRFFRTIQKSSINASPFQELNLCYNRILDDTNRDIAIKCGELMRKSINGNIKYDQLTNKEMYYADLLKQLEYIDIDSTSNAIFIKVPIFYKSEEATVIKDISDIILTKIFPLVKEVFESFSINSSDLTSVKHNVDMKEVANELWHLIFGATNEYLVKEGFVASPNVIDGEGRYLRSFTISDC